MILGPTIEVTDLESHYGFLTALFKDDPLYSFERINDHVYHPTNLSNGKQLNFRQATGAQPERVGLVSFMFMDKEDFDYQPNRLYI